VLGACCSMLHAKRMSTACRAAACSAHLEPELRASKRELQVEHMHAHCCARTAQSTTDTTQVQLALLHSDFRGILMML
jgi:hypothetical protein